MLAMLGDFKFEMNKTEFETLVHEIVFDYSDSKRIGNNPKTQAVGLSDEKFSLSGTLILKSIYAFDDLVALASKKEPVVLTMLNSSVLVTIRSIKKDMSIFLKTGEFIKQGFSCEIKRWYK
jgi:uncharacterized protein